MPFHVPEFGLVVEPLGGQASAPRPTSPYNPCPRCHGSKVVYVGSGDAAPGTGGDGCLMPMIITIVLLVAIAYLGMHLAQNFGQH